MNMKLPAPITITLPGLGEQTFAELPVTTIDSSALKRVQVQMRPFMKPLTLWEGDGYVAAGDYTQAQVEARVVEVLGSDPAKTLLGLWVAPQKR